MTTRKPGFTTRQVHAGVVPDPVTGAILTPIYQTTTYVQESVDQYLAKGYSYSRSANPTVRALENKLTDLEGGADTICFGTGMAAINGLYLSSLSAGDHAVVSDVVYGGTYRLSTKVYARFGVEFSFVDTADAANVRRAIRKNTKLILTETPANPTNALVDIAGCSELARRYSRPNRRVLVIVDNTFLGPLWQHPLRHGADLVIYSATKFIGGHSDVIAGVCLGARELIDAVKGMRTILGTMAEPMTGWLLMRSLETLKLRMTSQMKNARYVADFLADHPKVERVHYLGHLTEDSPAQRLYRRQCLSPGSMIAFDIRGGEAESFRFLNKLEIFHLAVSLGGTESLAEHPASMTHSDVDPEERHEMGIFDSTIRLSIGVEHPEDLIADLEQALAAV